MSNPESSVLEVIADHWQLPSDRGAPPTHSRNQRISPQDVKAAIAKRFNDEEAARQLAAFLTQMCELGEQNQVPNSYERFLCDCGLTLVSALGGYPISVELAQRIVRAFPLPIWYFPVGQMVGRWLNVSQLLETLFKGITQPNYPGMVQDGLAGFRMYLGAAQPDPSLRNDTPILVQTTQTLEQLKSSNDPETSRLAAQAQGILLGYLANIGLVGK